MPRPKAPKAKQQPSRAVTPNGKGAGDLTAEEEAQYLKWASEHTEEHFRFISRLCLAFAAELPDDGKTTVNDLVNLPDEQLQKRYADADLMWPSVSWLQSLTGAKRRRVWRRST